MSARRLRLDMTNQRISLHALRCALGTGDLPQGGFELELPLPAAAGTPA